MMRMTRHAMLRKEERSRLSLETLEAIFERNYPKKIGACRKPGKHNLVHQVFFSPSDRAFLVAIQDLADGAVITLLTFEQYRNHYAGAKIGKQVLREVNRMVVEGLAPLDCWQALDKGERVTVCATFIPSLRQVLLGQYQATLTGPDVRSVGSLPKFWAWVATRCKKMDLPIERIHSVTARHSYGEAQELHYLCA